MSDSATPWAAEHQASQSFTISQSLLKFMSIESVMLSNHLILCRLLLLLLSIFPSILVFYKESTLCLRRQKYWSFSLCNRAYNKYSGLISFRINWFDLLAVQRTRRSLLQHQLIPEHQFFGTQPFLLPALTIIHDYWKNHSFDYTDLCRQSNASSF